MLLRFRVANHRSIRDEQAFSLVSTTQSSDDTPSTLVPPTVRVAGIFGANASGKTSLIDAISFFAWTVRSSYQKLEPSDKIPRSPFLLDERSPKEPSFFELDFSFKDVRYTYGFEVDDSQILGEWFLSYPQGKRRTLFERDKNEYFFGRHLRGRNRSTSQLTRPNALFLSVAGATAHPELAIIHHYITSHLVFADSTSAHERMRLRWLANRLKSDAIAREVGQMLGYADLGLSGIELVEEDDDQNLTPEISEQGEINTKTGQRNRSKQKPEPKIALVHSSQAMPDGVRFPLEKESSGTRAWLSLIGRVLYALANGETLIVDEIDGSLHPLLSVTLIKIFKDRDLNQTNAQLVFTSHDVSFLGNLTSDRVLERDEIWFTEKSLEDGATTLYSLTEFKGVRSDANIERGYLQGRFGAVPHIGLDQIKAALKEIREEVSLHAHQA